MPQLAFQWQLASSYAPEDFISSDSNEEALKFVDSWPDGSAKAALICGEKSCGKTHLAHRWLSRVGGVVLDASALGNVASETLWQGATHGVLEDIDNIKDETALFHLLRDSETGGRFLLLTANNAAAQLPFTLPDLRSRLIAMPGAAMAKPDEQLLVMAATKWFSDRQLRVGEGVVPYIVNRVERSFSAVFETIGKIEEISLETNRDITVPLVKKVIGG